MTAPRGKAGLLRAATLVLALAHTFPARKHVALFFAAPSLAEAWKGFGAVLAIAIYLATPRLQARALRALWAHRPLALTLGGFVLAITHGVPALDHLPRFVAAPSWPDAWRGIGACFATAWFVAPLPMQARALAAIVRAVDVGPAFSGASLASPSVEGGAPGETCR